MATAKRVWTLGWILAGATLALTAGCSAAVSGQSGADDAKDARQEKSMKTQSGSQKERVSKSGYDITPLPREKVAELAGKLDEDAYRITQKAGTEPAGCGTLLDNKKQGVYACVVCGLPLFSSDHKFNSGTGWPSFYREFDPEHVSRKSDTAYGMVRTEINCARCGAHLGHVFEDGPKPTGERHCLNSASLKFYDKGAEMPPESRPMSTGKAAASGKTETAYFAGGCFWGVEHYFQQGPGVIDAVSGYMQGGADKPTYKQVCSGDTGHAETVKVIYDPSQISYRRLLEAFFVMHDPTELNRQGPDSGSQYRSGVWYASDDQKREAEKYIKELAESGRYGDRKIVTQVEKAQTFFSAEDYHQDYIAKTGRACHVKNPW
jgi:peptide methionine sulfoxide reductase msrA/msrB